MSRLQVIQGGGQTTGPTRAECDAIAAAVIEALTHDGAATAASVADCDRELRLLDFHLFATGLLLVVLVLAAPGGVLGFVKSWRLKRRYGAKVPAE